MKKLLSNPMILLSLDKNVTSDMASLFNTFETMFNRLRDRRTYNIQKDKQKIFTLINKLIVDLMKSKNSSGNSQSGGMQQLMKQLGQMSKGQKMVNMLSQGLLEQMMQQMMQGKKGGLSMEQRRRMERIAANEQRIKENLERALKEFPEAEKLMGDLGSLKKDMEEVIKKLNRGDLDKELIEKQQHIHSRLLDAQRSIHKRDFSKKRKAEEPEFDDFSTPDTLELDIQSIEVKDMLRFINENYPEEYHNLIKKYLEKIEYEE